MSDHDGSIFRCTGPQLIRLVFVNNISFTSAYEAKETGYVCVWGGGGGGVKMEEVFCISREKNTS